MNENIQQINQELVEELFEEMRTIAKKEYLQSVEIIKNINPHNVGLIKAGAIMSAGIFNKNKKDYERGYRLFVKACYVATDSETYAGRNTILLNAESITEENPKGQSKNEEAFRQICNWCMENKKIIDERNNDILRFGYFKGKNKKS